MTATKVTASPFQGVATEQKAKTEAEVLTVGEHLEMLCCQFLATCLQPSHPSYPIVTADPGPRNMKKTLLRSYRARVEDHMEEDGTVVDANAARREIHSAAVVRSIESKAPNRVLGTPAPAIDPEEEQLRRKTRRTLSQLRSGFCSSLKD